MKETKLYILIPVYNVEQYLDACLESILSQDYSEYEVILVNDGSKDSSGEICDRYAAKDKRIHVIHKENGGQTSARTAAIDHIRKNCQYKDTYSIFVDSDDELKAGALRAINEKISGSACDMLIYGCERFNPEGVYYTTLEEKTEEMLICDMGQLLRESILEHCYNSLCRKAIKTEMLSFEVADHIKDINMGEDLLHSLEIYRQNPRTLVTPEILYRYRTNLQSITQTFRLKKFTDELMSRYYTISVIKELNVWGEEDFERYINKSLSVLSWDIRHILLESPSRKDALDNLRQIYAHPFVKEYCNSRITKNSNVWLRNFSKGHFRTLWVLHKISMIKNSGKEKK